MEVVQFGISHSNSVVSLSLFLFFSILPLCLCLTRSLSPLCCVNRGEKEVRAWQALPRITRDINFTFQRLLLSLSLSSFRAWLSNICRRVLLPGTLFSSLKVVTDRLTGSTIFLFYEHTHTYTHGVKKGRPTVSSATVCILLSWSLFIHLSWYHSKKKAAVGRREGHKTLEHN